MKSEEFKKFSDPLELFNLWFNEAKKKESYNYWETIYRCIY